MKAKTIISILISLIIMLLFPLVAVNFIFGNDALGILLLLTVILNPLVSIGIGIAGGWSNKIEWNLSLINAIIYLISAIIITGFDFTYIIAAVAYFILGLIATYITVKIKK